jgi:hypothetical protein
VEGGWLRGPRISILGFSGTTSSPEETTAAYSTVAALAAEGRFEIPMEVYGLEEITTAWASQAASPGAKIVIRL